MIWMTNCWSAIRYSLAELKRPKLGRKAAVKIEARRS